MEKAFEFLKTNKEVAFATAEDGKPKIRVFQIMRQEKNILYFVTAPGKKIYRQLQKNPNIEVLAMRGNISVRIAGRPYSTWTIRRLGRYMPPTPCCRDFTGHTRIWPISGYRP